MMVEASVSEEPLFCKLAIPLDPSRSRVKSDDQSEFIGISLDPKLALDLAFAEIEQSTESINFIGARDLDSLQLVDEIAANRYPALDWRFALRHAERDFAESESWGEGLPSLCKSVERYVTHCALAFRKLIVQRVLTDEVLFANRPVLSYPCTKPPGERWFFEGTVDMENHHHFVRHYDLDRPRRESLQLQRLSDFLIHSFVFVVFAGDGGRYEDARFFFNSDRNKDRVVYEMTIGTFKSIVAEVLSDEVVYFETDENGESHQHNWVWNRERIEARERKFDQMQGR
jgi:hypothetical protein